MEAHAASTERERLRPVVGIDAGFLHTETTSTHWHVVGVVVLDDTDASAPFDAEMLRRLLAERIEHVEVLRRRIVDVSVAWSQPQWHHGEVDLDAQVRAATLPPGAGPAELAGLAGEIASRPLRRDRPLWEFTVVDGLDDGRKAIVAKIHHALVDGVAAVGVLGAVFDLVPRVPAERGTPTPAAGASPGRAEYVGAAARTVIDQPAVVARSLGRLARTAWHAVSRAARREDAPTLPLTAPRVCLSRSITPARSAAFATFPLDAVKEVRRAFGVTFNDVAVAVATGAIRRWLAEAGELPDRPLVAAVPTSVRAEPGGTSGNELSTLFGALPTHLADAADRVRFVAGEMPGAKAFHDELGPRTLGTLALVAPWNLAAALFRAYSDLGLADRLPPFVNLVLTSVPGPAAPLFCGDARVDAVFPLGPIFDGAALNVTVVSYTDAVCVGFLTCPDVCPPVQRLADAVPGVVDELVATSRSIDLAPPRKDSAMDVQERNRRALAAIRERRDEFYEAILALERAMATAAGDEHAAWASDATVAAQAMRSVLDDHIAETESEDGFFAEVVDHAPNLVHAAGRLQGEHQPLCDAVDGLLGSLETVRDDDAVEAVRQEALDLIRALLAHRHRGAELVFDAYNLDVATGD